MLAEREEVMNGLEALCSILEKADLPISIEDRKRKLSQIEQGKAIVRNKKYHVTALGIFSTGKSTLINSMIGEDYLPAADHPTTARITEIRPSAKAFVILHTETSPTEKELDAAKKLLSKLGYDTGKKGNIQVQSKMVLEPTDSDSEVVLGIVIMGTDSSPLKAHDVQKILSVLGAEARQIDSDIVQVSEDLKKMFKDIIIGLPVAEWMSDIVLTDAPGTGSIVESHEKIINKIIPESQLVLHIVDAERIGDSTDKNFAERIANFQHRKIFYVMNKIDRMSHESCDEAEIDLKKQFPSGTTEDCAPEIIKVSALSALRALQLKSGQISIDEIRNDRKLAIGHIFDKEFYEMTEAEQKKKLYDTLCQISNFAEFQSRVETYLRKENKQMAIVEDARGLIRGVAADVKNALEKALSVLSSDTKIEEMEHEKCENEKKRKELKRVADRALAEYKVEIWGGISEETGKNYSGVADEVCDSLEESKRQIEIDLRKWLDSYYDSITDNPKEMTQHIQRLIEGAITCARKVAEEKANAAIANLKREIVDVLREARDLSLLPMDGKNKTSDPDLDTSIALLGIGITGGSGLGGAGVGAGIGAGIGSIIPGAGTAIGAGIGAGVGLIAGLISGGVYMGKKGKAMRIDKIASQVTDSLQIIFFDGGKLSEDKNAEPVEPYFGIIKKDLNTCCDKFIEELQQKIEDRFDELNKRDATLIQNISSSKEDRESKTKKYTDLSKQCDALVKKAC